MQTYLFRGIVALLSTLAFLWWQAPAQAQGVHIVMPKFPLLIEEAVQKELKLSEDQVKKIKAEVDGLYQDGPNGEKLLMFDPSMNLNEYDERVEKLLKPEQVKRLSELQLQRVGYRGLTLPRVVKELNLTGDQQKKIEEVLEFMQRKLMEKAQDNLQNNQEGTIIRVTPEMLAEIEKEMAQELDKVITAEQKKKWQEMKGAKFDFPKRPMKKAG